MALQDIVDAVQAQLGSTPCLLGAQHLRAESAPPRVVFVPTADKFSPAESAGRNPRQLWTRLAGCSVHLWAADVGATEALLNSVIAAFDVLVGGPNYKLDGQAEWMNQDGALTNLGVGYAFHVAFKVPITAAPVPAKVVTEIPQTNKLHDEDAG